MKTKKMALAVIVILLLLSGQTSLVWAGGAGGVLGCCVAERLGPGHVVLKGTWTVVYSPYMSDPNPAYIDVKLRLERGERIGFFELNLIEDVYGLDNFEVGCVILNPNEPYTLNGSTGSRVAVFVDEILTTFFPDCDYDHTNRLLVLTRKSFKDTDGPGGGPIPETNRIAVVGDVKIYVVDPAEVRLEDNPNCVE